MSKTLGPALKERQASPVQEMAKAENEADIKLGKISIESPIGKGLVGKEIGDIADVDTPNGIVQFEILGISR